MVKVAIAKAQVIDGPWGLRDGWEWAPLGSLCQAIVGGGTPDRSNPKYWGGDIPWASVKDLKTDKLLSTQEFITLEGLEKSAAKLVEPGTVIVATRMGLGKVCIAQKSIAINQDLKGLILSPHIFAEYLVLYLRSCATEIERQGTEATVKGIKLEELRAWPVPLPFRYDMNRSLETQRRIVARIETLLTEVKRARILLEHMRRDIDQFDQSILKRAFRGEL
jgi:type I restriction enzyme S subunit